MVTMATRELFGDTLLAPLALSRTCASLKSKL